MCVACIECVRSCDQKPYLHNETKGGICTKIEFNPQKNISLLQDGRCFFVYSSNMAAVTSSEHTLFLCSSILWTNVLSICICRLTETADEDEIKGWIPLAIKTSFDSTGSLHITKVDNEVKK